MSKTRSKNGCLTCRGRKRKCDEHLYPECLNCQINHLECTWPAHVSHFYKEPKTHSRIEKAAKVTDTDRKHPPPKRIDKSTLSSLEEERPSPPNSKSRSTSYEYRKPNFVMWEDPTFDSCSVSEVQPPLDYTSVSHQPHLLDKSERSEHKKRNLILERIAMQQDLVDDDSDQETTFSTDAERTNPQHIRNRIAQQMDIASPQL